jgi:FAD/FMN-containing dehydrogenase
MPGFGPTTTPSEKGTLMNLETLDATRADLPVPAALELRGMCGDVVHLPGGPAYDAARTPWNVSVDQRPAAVATPRSVDEVRLVVRSAAAVGLRVAPQGTGHGAQPFTGQDLSDVVLLRTTALTRVTVDAERRVFRAESGAIWGQVVDGAAPYGLAALHGSSPDVGVAGLSLGGGIGWYARKLGMAANAITAVELVTADGRLHRADADHEPELFWAVRGGGGNFGVVTAIEMRLFDVADVYAGQLVWDIADFERVLREWNDWAPEALDEISTSLRAMRFPPLPDIPEHLRGRKVVILDGAVLGTDEQATALLARFRDLAPQVDTWQRVPAAGIVRMHGDPEGPTPAVGCGTLVHRLDEPALRSFVAAVGPEADTSVLMAELRQLGGALAREPEGAGAMATMSGDYAAYFVTIAPVPQLLEPARQATLAMLGSLEAVHSGGEYLNLAERPVDPSGAFGVDRWRRILDVRRRVDPTGLFLGNHVFVG